MKMISKTEDDLKHLDDLNNEDEPKNEDDPKSDLDGCGTTDPKLEIPSDV